MRILGRPEKALLVVAGGFAFVLLAAIVAPGLQTTVGRFACPSGAGVDAVVVRYPHVDEPAAMVRNTPLVCLEPGGPVLADHWRVLPALFAVGAAATAVDVALGSALVGLARRAATRAPAPQPPKRAVDSIRFLPLLIGMPFVGMAVFAAYWWLAVDTPYRVTGCRSSSGGSATCYDGEPVYRLLTILFGLLALVALAVWFVALARSLGRRRRFADVVAGGARATATLVAADGTNVRINGRRQLRFRYRVEPTDGSAPFEVVEKGLDSPAGVVGGRVEVLYDRADPTTAFVVPAGWVAPTTPSSPLVST